MMAEEEEEDGSKETVLVEEEEEDATVATRTDSSSLRLLETARKKWLSCDDDDEDGVDHNNVESQEEVESTYRSLWNRRKLCGDDDGCGKKKKNDNNYSDTDDERQKQRPITKRRKLQKQTAVEEDEQDVSASAGERLALILLQTGRWEEADHTILKKLGFKCRLAAHIFNYEHDDDDEEEKDDDDSNNSNNQRRQQQQQQQQRILPVLPEPSTADSSTTAPCRIYDNFFSDEELLRRLNDVFLDPRASYWTDHNYNVEPPSPYFSYVVPLIRQSSASEQGTTTTTTNDDRLVEEYGALGIVINKLQQQIATWKPGVAKMATHCEMWAHNRPPGTGHQLHFDSDNEGCGSTVRHPLVTAIVYLTNAGGPTLVTNQRLASRRAADRGWLAHPKRNRVVLMDGRVLHCVVPGKKRNRIKKKRDATTVTSGPSINSSSSNYSPGGGGAGGGSSGSSSNNRRVTLMLAFWKRIRVRDENTPGAARPFPTGGANGPVREQPSPSSWSSSLRAPLHHQRNEGATTNDGPALAPITEAQPSPTVVGEACCRPAPAVPFIYEDIESGRAWTRQMGMPEYDQVFQGI